MSPATVLHYVSHAKSFYEWAVKAALIPANPAAAIPVPRIGRGLPRPISEDELAAALNAAPDRIRPWLVLAGWCGLRAKEIAYLRAENILLRAKTPVIVVAADSSKGRHERIVPLSAFVIAELAKCDMPGRGWVFRRLDGRDGPNAPWVVSQLAGEHLRSCGISASLHQLRHRFGTMTYQRSRDLLLVQELLGHTNPATTAIYAAYDRAGALDAVEGLPVPRPPAA